MCTILLISILIVLLRTSLLFVIPTSHESLSFLQGVSSLCYAAHFNFLDDFSFMLSHLFAMLARIDVPGVLPISSTCPIGIFLLSRPFQPRPLLSSRAQQVGMLF